MDTAEKADIIKSHPLKEGLIAFCHHFESSWARLSVVESSSVVESVLSAESGSEDLVLDVIGALQTLPAIFSAPDLKSVQRARREDTEHSVRPGRTHKSETSIMERQLATSIRSQTPRHLSQTAVPLLYEGQKMLSDDIVEKGRDKEVAIVQAIVLEDVSAAQDAYQVVASTNGNPFLATRVSTGARAVP